MPFLVQGIENVNIGDILRNIGKKLAYNHFCCFNLFPIHFLFFTENRPGNGLLVQLYIYSDVCPFQEVINSEILINSVGNKYITLFFLKANEAFQEQET